MALTSINDAIAAYNATARTARGLAPKPEETAPAGGGETGDFGSLVREGVKSAIDQSKKSEQMSMQALAGKADIRDVVAAVNNAQLTLQTVVAVRDKVINAYNFIMQMPI